ncbi:TonB-dependent receptor [Pseudomonas sp. 7P_10.2_Bac1]|uniref:TonB-dependent siderophore receptor n=1 Tax=Pseudomonas sp. 7P_10.2_Bac1 TaxID=2971614 RepID=UPI0021C7087D|nr:TonB-dependent receptor [Pseudomonas sp. 7P_10.2_Bac1]MCU1729726.1 TonB-dependent receptor [Pseudomonas sp. 7P_10.2_Bac1]
MSGAVQPLSLPARSHLAIALQAVLLGGAMLVAAQPFSMTVAAPVSAQRSFDVPASDLEDSLNRFAQQANITLPYDPALVRNKQAPALKGRFEVSQALQHLLKGSGLTATEGANGVWTLYPLAAGGDGQLQLQATSVTAVGLGETTEGSQSYTTGETRTATKLPLSLRETPQSVTVMTRQQMTDQGLGSIAQVMGQTPGITVMHDDSERYNFYSRGFTLDNFQYDGVPTSDFTTNTNGLGMRDMAIYDRVEVVRGSTGLMSGVGSPSGAVNLVRKRPTKDFQGYVSGSGGSWDRYRSELDLSGPLSENGAVRGRVVAAHEDGRSFIDRYSSIKDVFYGIGEADLTDDTTLYAGIDYQKINSNGSSFGQLPLYYSDGSRTHFRRSMNPAAKWAFADSKSTKYFAGVEQRFDNEWLLKVEASHWKGNTDQLQGNLVGWGPFPDKTTGEAQFMSGTKTFDINTDTLDAYATGPFEFLGRSHELVVGANISNRRTDYLAENADDLTINYQNWNNDAPRPTDLSEGLKQRYKTKESALYGALRLKPTDDLSIILGTRVVDYDRKGTMTYNADQTTPTLDNSKKTGKPIPYAGIVYDLSEQHSVYASYTEIFTPQSYFDRNDKVLAPMTGKSYEAGFKSEYFEGALNTSFAVFLIKQNNYAEYDGERDNGEEAYKAIDGTKTKGFEAEISGEIARGWQLLAGYTYAQPRDKDGKRINSNHPEQLFKLSTSYQLDGKLKDLTVGGNVAWQGSTYSELDSSIKADAKEGSFAVVGLMARYDISQHLSATVNLNNVFDREYLSGYGLYSTYYYGDPRNLMLGLKYSF